MHLRTTTTAEGMPVVDARTKRSRIGLDRLEAERDEVLAEMENLRQLVRYEPDTTDEGDLDVYEREKALALLQSLERKLESVNHAIALAQQGSYGLCERCGEDIDPARLEVLPHATLCLACQRAVERYSRAGGFAGNRTRP
jgi:DnaK suppressor protein